MISFGKALSKVQLMANEVKILQKEYLVSLQEGILAF